MIDRVHAGTRRAEGAAPTAETATVRGHTRPQAKARDLAGRHLVALLGFVISAVFVLAITVAGGK